MRKMLNLNIRRSLILLIVAIAAALPSVAAPKGGYVSRPRLIVNIVVGSMGSDVLDRYTQGYTDLGFNRFGYEGTRFTAASYSHVTPSTSSALATLSTGTTPSTHGVVGDAWYDYTTSQRVELTFDPHHKNIEYDTTEGGDSPINIVAPTFAEKLRQSLPKSITATIALDATSAIAMNGVGGIAIWLDPQSCKWASSTAYAPKIYDWLKKANRQKVEPVEWVATLPAEGYLNSCNFGLLPSTTSKPIQPIELPALSDSDIKEWRNAPLYNNLAYTPAGNRQTLNMAYEMVERLDMGQDEYTDLINVVLNTSGNITYRFGAESVEVEDMYYKLDRDLGEFIEKVRARTESRDVIFVLTADHGISPSYDVTAQRGGGEKLFNIKQFEMLVNTFLSAKYGAEEWVIGFENRSIYLNHELIYKRKMSLDKLQDEVATFALQCRGVSHALTSLAMRNSYFAAGYAEKIQKAFYPSRSGDVTILLMPEWIEQRDYIRSQSGSIYRYDTDVPLVIWGSGVSQQSIVRPIDMTSLAPTLAAMVKIAPPAASDGKVIWEMTKWGYKGIKIGD